jgi:hypothetical protein
MQQWRLQVSGELQVFFENAVAVASDFWTFFLAVLLNRLPTAPVRLLSRTPRGPPLT